MRMSSSFPPNGQTRWATYMYRNNNNFTSSKLVFFYLFAYNSIHKHHTQDIIFDVIANTMYNVPIVTCSFFASWITMLYVCLWLKLSLCLCVNLCAYGTSGKQFYCVTNVTFTPYSSPLQSDLMCSLKSFFHHFPSPTFGQSIHNEYTHTHIQTLEERNIVYTESPHFL